MNRGRKFLGVFLAAALALLGLGLAPFAAQAATTELPPAVGAQELQEAYKKDPSKTTPVYDGETLVVTGVVVYVGPDIHNLPSIELSNAANDPGQVLCVFDSPDSLQGVSRGDKMTITGKFHIVSSDDKVVLKQSEIL